jgi:hypothetical protein
VALPPPELWVVSFRLGEARRGREALSIPAVLSIGRADRGKHALTRINGCIAASEFAAKGKRPKIGSSGALSFVAASRPCVVPEV